ncbi:hypothetical protein ACOTFF_15680 [Achromobacter xylosoxidans]
MTNKESSEVDEPEDRSFFSDFIEFLAHTKAKDQCPVCESSAGWSVVGTDLGDNVSYPVITTKTITKDGSPKRRISRVIVVECKNCGFVRMHAFRVFRKWLETKNTEYTEVEEIEDTSNGGSNDPS